MTLSELAQNFDFEFPVLRNASNTLSTHNNNVTILRRYFNSTFTDPYPIHTFQIGHAIIIFEILSSSINTSIETVGRGKYNQAHINKIKRVVNNLVKEHLKKKLERFEIPKYLYTALYIMIFHDQNWEMQIASLKIFNRVCCNAGINPLQADISIEEIMNKSEKDLTIDEIGMKIKHIKSV